MYNPKTVTTIAQSNIMSFTAGEDIKARDFVVIITDGEVEVAATGEGIFGVALADADSGDTVSVERAYPGMRVLMDNDNVVTTFAATHVGARFNIIGASGAQLVDTSTAAQDGTDTGQLFCVGFNPQGHGFDADTSIGLFEIAEVQGLTNAIS